MKIRLMPLLGITFSAVIVILLLKALDLGEVARSLEMANYAWLVPAILLSLFSFIFRGQRFRSILRPLSDFSLRKSYGYIAINYMANNVLPARAGEVLLSYVVRQQQHIPISSSLAVTLLGRVIDGLILLTVLLTTISFLSFPGWVIQIVTLGFVIFGGVMVGLIWLVLGQEQHLSAVSHWLRRVFPHWITRPLNLAINQLQKFRRGLLPLRSRRLLAQTIVNSLLIWLCEGLVYYLVGQAFGLQAGLAGWLFVLALSNLATSIPSAPAGIGTFHGIVILSLGLIGIEPSLAAAYAVVLHVTQVVPITGIGAASYAWLMSRRPPHAISDQLAA